MKIKIILVVMLLLTVGLLSGCIANEEEKGWTKYKEGLLINSEYHRGIFDLPSNVVLYFSDASMVKINGDSDNITKDSLFQISKYYKGENVEVVYFKDTSYKGDSERIRIVCISFNLVNKTMNL